MKNSLFKIQTPNLKRKAEKREIGKQGLVVVRLALACLCFRFFAFSLSAFGLTTFTYQLYNSDGTPFTNTATMTPWPVVGNSVSVYGTSIVFARTITLAPGSNGAGSVAVEPNTYRITYAPATGATISFLVNVPDTTNTLPLAAYVSNAPAVYMPASLYAFLTNGLGGPAGIVQALQFQPMTNSVAGVTNVTGVLVPPTVAGITNITGPLIPPTVAGVTNITGVLIPPTLAGVTNITGVLVPPTMAGITNLTGALLVPTVASITNVTGALLPTTLAGITNITGVLIPPTLAGITNITGVLVPPTAAGITNLLGTVIVPAPEIWTTNTPLFAGVMPLNGLTNRLATNSSQLITLTLGNTNGGLTGSFSYTNGSGSHSTFYVTNGIVITNTTP